MVMELNESFIAGMSPDGDEQESATFKDDRLMLTQPRGFTRGGGLFKFIAIVRKVAPAGRTPKKEFLSCRKPVP